MNGYWFTSTKFEIEPGEDEEINPVMFISMTHIDPGTADRHYSVLRQAAK